MSNKTLLVLGFSLPGSDGCGFWDSDSGILGLSVPCSDGCRGDDHQ